MIVRGWRRVTDWLAARETETVGRVYRFWVIVVLLNAVVGLFFGFLISSQSPQALLGIVAAVVSCIFIYAKFELYLLKAGHAVLSKQLRISACLRVFMQLLPFIDMLLGVASIESVRFVFQGLFDLNFDIMGDPENHRSESGSRHEPVGFLFTYSATMMHAFLASTFVAALVFLGRLVGLIWQRKPIFGV